MRVREQAPAWLAVPAATVILWLIFGVRAVAAAVVFMLACTLAGAVMKP